MKRLVTIVLLGISVSTLFGQSKWTYITSQNGNNEQCEGILLDDGTELVKPIFERIVFSDNYFFLKQNSKWGVIDSTGKTLIQPLYDDIGFGISENLIRVKKENKWGYIDLTGETIIEFIYDFACNFINEKAYVIINEKPIFISKTGEKVGSTQKLENFCPEDEETADVIENQFDSDKSIMIIELESKYGVVDTTETVIIPIEFDEIGFYYNGIIVVRKGNLWGAYKNNGELIVEPKYQSMGLFNYWR